MYDFKFQILDFKFKSLAIAQFTQSLLGVYSPWRVAGIPSS